MMWLGLESCPKRTGFRIPRWWKGVSFGCVLLSVSACSALEPIVDPELSDLQLTIDTLKISLRDAQRTMTELRDEVDARRQEWADLQIARAQLEGRLRETERRFVEARHVIDLQREELADARSERERATKAEVALKNQVKQLQKQVAKMRKHTGASSTPAAMTLPGESSGVASTNSEQSVLATMVDESVGAMSKPAMHVSGSLAVTGMPVTPSMGTPTRIFVYPGDTLWGLARRYHVSVKHLMEINALLDHHIEVGQMLWLTESVTNEH